MKDKQGWTRDTPAREGVYWYWHANFPDWVQPIVVSKDSHGFYEWPSGVPLRSGHWQRAEVPTPPGQADREEG